MAGRLSIGWDPLDPAGIEDTAIAATWASLRIDVEGVAALEGTTSQCLTYVLDRHAKWVRREVYVSVLPLAEWIARCWHSLFSSQISRPPNSAPRRERRTWQRTHCWTFCGEGTAIPNVEFARLDEDYFECSWEGSRGDERDEYERVLFLSRGKLLISARDLEHELSGFVESVLARLDAVDPANPRAAELRELWGTARDGTHPNYEHVRLCARLGLHWYGLTDQERQQVSSQLGRITDPISWAGIESSRLEGLEDLLGETARLWELCERSPPITEEWRDLRRSLAGRDRKRGESRLPWDRGWAAAHALRDQQRRSHRQPWTELDLNGDVAFEPLESDAIPGRAVIGWSSGRRPLVAAPAGASRHKSRFARTRDLYPLLFSGDSGVDFGCVLSQRIAGLMPVANAFATELLAPIAQVRELVASRKRLANEEVAELAEQLDAPEYCVRHQLENHEVAEVSD